MNLSYTARLLDRVAQRCDLVQLGGRARHGLLLLAGACAVLLLLSRLTGLLPDRFGVASVVLPPIGALIPALILFRRTRRAAAARRVDAHAGSKDLFFTASQLGHAAGDFHSLVAERAEAAAADIRAAAVVPFGGWRSVRHCLLAMALLAAGALFLPATDLFGRGEDTRIRDRRQAELESTRKATALRIENLKKEKERTPENAAQRNLAELHRAFQAPKPGQRKARLARMQELRKQLSEAWRKAHEAQKKKLDLRGSLPRFGDDMTAERRAWRDDLRQGDGARLRRELDAVRDAVKRLADAADGADQEKLRDALERQLEQLKEFAEQDARSEALAKALERALEQLDLADVEGFEAEALEGLLESLDLAELELDSICRSIADLGDLEEALEALRLAKACMECELLEEGQPGQQACLADYAAFFRTLLAGRPGEGGGAGPGMRGPGTGAGGEAPTDDSVASGFQSELSRSALRAGKLLLKWKSHGAAPAGRVETNYQELVRRVKQGMSEAVRQEQVPAGYHEAIKKYFDSIGQDAAPATGTKK